MYYSMTGGVPFLSNGHVLHLINEFMIRRHEMKTLKVIGILFIFLLVIGGCLRDKSEPITIDNIFDNPSVEMAEVNCALGVLGTFNLSIPDDNLTVDLSTMRKLSIGESYIVSGEAFFAISPCRDCLRINSVGLNPDNNIIVEFALKHPFPKGSTNEDPSPTNRLDLDIFDVALFFKPENLVPAKYELTETDIYSGIILNASGYSKELKNLIDEDAALPYKICYESQENNRFEMGTTWQYFNVIISKPGLNFGLYLTMSYGASAKMYQRLNPVYYVPEFNRKTAWKVEVEAMPWYQDYPTTVIIDIFDWNHGSTVAENFPDPDHANYISTSSDISSVTVEVPGMTNNIIVAETNDSETNGWDDPIRYKATFTNENELPVGDYIGLVNVNDSREPGIVIFGGEIDTLAHSIGGKELAWRNIPEFATYQTFKASVVDYICGPITGEVIAPLCPIEDVYNGQTIDFIVLASSAYGGEPIVLYEADWDYDGITFDVDSFNTNGVFEDAGPFDNPNCGGSNDPVTYTVAFRATDSCSPPNKTIFKTCEVTVAYCCGPITGVIITPTCPVMGIFDGQTVDFVVSASSAAGGDPVYFYDVDIDYDGYIFERYAFNGNGLFENLGPFYNPNCGGTEEPVTYNVAFRAIDSCNPPNVTIFATCEVTVNCPPPPVGWARTWGGEKQDSAVNVAFDSFGNIYVVGAFYGAVDLDPGNGEDWHYSPNYGDYINKFDRYGDLIWARTWDTNGDLPFFVDITIDNSSNLFVTGGFRETVDFDPGPGFDIRTAAGISHDADIFISKFDINGNYVGVITFGGDSQDEGYAISASDSGVYTTGLIHETVDFDPGPGEDKHSGSAYICRYDTNLNLVWAWAFGIYNNDRVFSEDVLVDNSGNVFWVGGFDGEVDFDPGPGEDIHYAHGSETDAFLGKFDCDGNYEWTRTWGTASNSSVSLNESGNIFVAGAFSGTVDFDPSPSVYEITSNGECDAYLSSFDTDGNFYWVRSWGGENQESCQSLYSDVAGNIYITGFFQGLADFDPGPGLDEVESHGNYDVFLSKFDQNGNYFWARTWGSEDNDNAWDGGVISDDYGIVYMVGDFSKMVDFDPGPGEDFHSSSYLSDAYLLKLLPNGYWE